MRQIQKRLQKLTEAIRPDDDSFTFMELYRSMWDSDKKSFLKLANNEFPMLSLAVAQFEADDLEAERTRDRSR
jgi:hypothetical protein